MEQGNAGATSAASPGPTGHGAGAAAHVLSNGRYTVLVTGAGGGASAFHDLALTRWAPDRTRDADGFFLYVRDLDGGDFWSAGLQPVQRAADRYDVQFSSGCAQIVREDDGVETTTEVCVAPDHDVELRRLTVMNRGARARRLEVTTYAEVVLNTAAADTAHPAFSKLFVQTEYLADRQALLAKRRLRSPEDEPVWLVHALWADAGGRGAPPPQYETNRARFIGRGRTLADPAAMAPGAQLSGETGNVLDPVLSLRRVLELAPGATASVVAVLGAGRSEASVEALAERFAGGAGAVAAVDDAFRRAEEWAREVVDEVGLTAHRARGLAQLTGAHAYGDAEEVLPGAGQMPSDDRELVAAARRAVAAPPGPPPTDTMVEAPAAPPPFRPATDPHAATSTAGRHATGNGGREEPLLYFNGYGGFTEDGTEYVIRVARDPAGLRWPPLPWTNVIANEEFGFFVSESGAGTTWCVNSRQNRLTPWSNDPVSDPHGEALYLRDEDAGVFWSPTPGPTPGPGGYEVRHGFGYTRYRHTSLELEQDVVQFVPRHDSLKIVRLRVTNRSGRPRRLSAFAYAQWVLGGYPWQTARSVVTERDSATGAIFAVNRRNGEFSDRVAFAAPVVPATGAAGQGTADRTAFLGRYGSVAAPAALRGSAPLDGRAGAGLDPCAAFQVPLDVGPDESVECAFLLGQAESGPAARALVSRYRDVAAIDAALRDARAFWSDTLAGVQVATPSAALDVMVNGWLAYQNLSCRVWGRSAFYQSGGAFGFRDQLQDSSALLYLLPELTRRQIVLHAAHQFVEGDVLHWWHPPLSKGMRTRFSDDLLWLPYIATFYLEATGDASVLDEEAPFVTARQLEPGEDETFLVPEDSGQRADVYEHCCRALDRSLTKGVHGLPLMGTGDWNDGMNRVGREGRGESVWLGFFLFDILNHFIPHCERRGDEARAARYRAYRSHLAAAVNADDGGWDGAWYRRANYDDGAPLGSAANDECRIDTIAQGWSVLSGAAPPDRAAQALDAMERYLVSEREGIIRLLTPAFDKTPHDPGYIKGYLPGVRENGGQYTHGALWAVRALAEFGRNERAAPLLEMLSPVSHARTASEVAVYQTEPYVIAADVYGVAPHVGRGGWTWYTGSAGWMYRVALESVLGFRLSGGDAIALRPCIPDAWPGFTLRYGVPGDAATYEIVVRRAADGATVATVDGAALAVDDGAVVIPLHRDGAAHHVAVTLGRDVGPRYVPRVELAETR